MAAVVRAGQGRPLDVNVMVLGIKIETGAWGWVRGRQGQDPSINKEKVPLGIARSFKLWKLLD